MEVTLNDLLTSISEIYIKEIIIPDLKQNPFVISPISLKNQQYYFEFFWNERQERCHLSIFRLIDGVRKYYIKDISLINNMKVSQYIKNTDWEGILYFENIGLIFDTDYTINDISESFILRYIVSP